jgi:hypothetical protein
MMQLAPQWFPDVAAGQAPTVPGMAISLAFGTLSAILGGYVLGVIARRDVMRHLYALSALLVVFGLVSAAMYGGQVPLSYSLLVVALGLAGYYLGAQLYLRRAGGSPAA